MFDYDSPGYKSWVQMGKYVNRPQVKGIVIVSAHWESGEVADNEMVVQSESAFEA